MIRRRMLELVAVTGLRLSVTMARLTLSCKAGRHPLDEVKKAGGEAGGPHRPLPFRRRGAFSTGRVANKRERALDPPPGKSRRRGRIMPATPSHPGTPGT